MDSTQREELVYNAKLAEQAERYDEMADFMKAVAQHNGDLSVEERNLLSVAYKNAVGARRASWRIISSVEHKKKTKGSQQHVQLAAKYRMKVEGELNGICNDILDILDSSLIPAATTAESRVFYYKMKGDYYRYISEFALDGNKSEPTDEAREAYEQATALAQSELAATHPVRLGLALNYSVFFYEIVNDPTAACNMAKKAFDGAIAELDTVSEESYRDSTLIMHLLRDNLTLWNPQEEQPAEGGSAEGDWATTEVKEAEKP